MKPTVGVDPLAALRGLHLPEPVGFWPVAPGWWILVGATLLLVAGAVVWRHRRRTSLARHALSEVERLSRSETDPQRLATALSALLRRVALRRFGRPGVASLSGVSWQIFLRDNGPVGSGATGFEGEPGRWLVEAPYRPPDAAVPACGRESVLSAAREWIRWNT